MNVNNRWSPASVPVVTAWLFPGVLMEESFVAFLTQKQSWYPRKLNKSDT